MVLEQLAGPELVGRIGRTLHEANVKVRISKCGGIGEADEGLNMAKWIHEI